MTGATSAVICEPVRTPIGRYGGALAKIRIPTGQSSSVAGVSPNGLSGSACGRLLAELDDLTDIRDLIERALVDEPPAFARDGGLPFEIRPVPKAEALAASALVIGITCSYVYISQLAPIKPVPPSGTGC